MAHSILFISILPLLASCQYNPIDTTGFGPGIPSNSQLLISSAHFFQGFNLTIPITQEVDTANTTNSTDTWSLLTNYSFVEVPTSNGNVTVGITDFALGLPALKLDYPPQQWPLNSTDWQLCTGILLNNLPSSISNKRGNETSADCSQFLGEACVTAWAQAYREDSLSSTSGCPAMPSLSDIEECAGVGDAAAGTDFGPITNVTDPNLIYHSANQTFVNPHTGQTYNTSNVPYQGLSWGQYFAYQTKVFPSNSSNLNASLLAQGRQLHVLGLTLVPSDAFVAAHANTSFGWETNVRMLCARADTSAAGNSVIQNMPLFAICTALMATIATVW